MANYEKQFEQIASGLNINDRPNAEHKKTLRQQMLAAAKDPSKKTAPRILPIWSKIMKSNLTKSAVAAAIIIIGAFIFLTQGEGVSIALADVAKKIGEMKNCAFEKTTTVFSKEYGVKSHNSMVYYTEGDLREDICKDNENVTNQVYVNYLEGIIVGVDHKMKLFKQVGLTEEDIEMGATIAPGDIVNSILSKGDYKKLGRKMIDGVLSDGFEFNDKRTLLSTDKEKTKKITIRLWADVNTKLPVRIEADAKYNGLHVSVVQNNPKWDIELEADFFEPKIPANYMKPEERGLIGVDLENWPKLKIFPGMAAEKAGIKDGDVVLKVNGNSIENIKSSDDAQKFLLGKVGDKVIFTVRRGEQIINIEVIREPLPK